MGWNLHCAPCSPSYWPLVGWIMGLTLQHSQVEAWEWLLVSITGEVPRVKWEVKRNTPEGLPQPLWLFPALHVNRNILPHYSNKVIFPFECRHEAQFPSLPSLHILSFSGWSYDAVSLTSHLTPGGSPHLCHKLVKVLQSSRLPGFSVISL